MIMYVCVCVCVCVYGCNLFLENCGGGGYFGLSHRVLRRTPDKGNGCTEGMFNRNLENILINTTSRAELCN